jgi:hypothetical protein
MMQWLFTDKWEPILENKTLGLKVEGLNMRLCEKRVTASEARIVNEKIRIGLSR